MKNTIRTALVHCGVHFYSTESIVHGRSNVFGRPGGCRTNNLTNKNFYIQIMSTFLNVKWTPIVLSLFPLSFSVIYRLFHSRLSHSELREACLPLTPKLASCEFHGRLRLFAVIFSAYWRLKESIARPNFLGISEIWAATTAKRMKADPYCQRQNCSPVSVLFSIVAKTFLRQGFAIRILWTKMAIFNLHIYAKYVSQTISNTPISHNKKSRIVDLLKAWLSYLGAVILNTLLLHA